MFSSPHQKNKREKINQKNEWMISVEKEGV